MEQELSVSFYFIVLFFLSLFILERERGSVSGGRGWAERGGDRGSEEGSVLTARAQCGA